MEIETAIIRIEDGKLVADMPRIEVTPPTTITEQAFYEGIDKDTARALKEFFDKAQGLGIGLEPDIKKKYLGLKVHTPDRDYNLGSFTQKGRFRNWGIAEHTERFGHPEIGEEYLERLASLFENGYVDKPNNKLQ